MRVDVETFKRWFGRQPLFVQLVGISLAFWPLGFLHHLGRWMGGHVTLAEAGPELLLFPLGAFGVLGGCAVVVVAEQRYGPLGRLGACAALAASLLGCLLLF